MNSKFKNIIRKLAQRYHENREEAVVPANEASTDAAIHPRVLEDGITHINIDQRGKTPLGRSINHYSETPFVHKDLGYFVSMMAFWTYIRAVYPTDEMRYLSGPCDWLKAKNVRTRHVNNFQAILEDAYLQMFEQNAELGDWVADSTLPFDSYYIHNNHSEGGVNLGIMVRSKSASWHIPLMERVRLKLKEGTGPTYEDCSALVAYINGCIVN